MKRWVICDIDGTIADTSRREHLVPDWDAFHADMENDPPFLDTIQLLSHLSGNYRVLMLTGRPEKYRTPTIRWLKRHEIYHELVMRPDSDFNKAPILKWNILCERFGGDEGVLGNVFMVIDDQDKIVEHFRNKGLFVIQPRIGSY